MQRDTRYFIREREGHDIGDCVYLVKREDFLPGIMSTCEECIKNRDNCIYGTMFKLKSGKWIPATKNKYVCFSLSCPFHKALELREISRRELLMVIGTKVRI